MKVCVPEISWHNCEPIYSIHMYPSTGPNGCYYIATGAADRLLRLWRLHFENTQANPVQVNFVAEFTVHQASVNVVRFSPDSKYMMSGSDDRSLVLWEVGSFDVKKPGDNDDDYDARDIWPVKKIFRGHLEGVYDLSWSPCSTRVASASVDNSVIVWDVATGNKIVVLREAKSYVQGVAWDPRNEFIVTLSSDKQARFYSIPKAYSVVSRLQQAAPVVGSTSAAQPQAPSLFADDMVTRSFFRRAGFSPDGRFVILSGGVVEVPVPQKAQKIIDKIEKNEDSNAEKASVKSDKDVEIVDVEMKAPTPTPTPTNGTSSSQPQTMQRHAAHMVTLSRSAKPGKPILSWPNPRRAIIGAQFCPITFEPTHSAAKKRDVEGMPVPSGVIKSRRRFVAALVAADAIILVETSRTCRPIGYITGLHIDQLTDASWTADGRILMASSTDGYCTLVVFGQNELGTPMAVQPIVEMVEAEGEKKKKSSKPKEPKNHDSKTSDGIKKRIVLQPVNEMKPEAVAENPSSANAFFGLGETESSKSSVTSETTSAAPSSLPKMETDSTSTKPVEAVVAPTVSVLIPRRRVNLQTVSLPGTEQPLQVPVEPK